MKQNLKRSNLKLRLFLFAIIALAISSIALVTWNTASAYEDPEFYNSEENINWQELYGTFNNDYYDYAEAPQATTNDFAYKISIQTNKTDEKPHVGNIYNYTDPENPTLLTEDPYTFDFKGYSPKVDPWFNVEGNNLYLYDGTIESEYFPANWFIPEGLDTTGFLEWEVKDAAGNKLEPGDPIEGDLTCTAIFYDKGVISGFVEDEEGTPFPGVDVKFENDIDGRTYTTTTALFPIEDIGKFYLDVPVGSKGTLTLSYINTSTRAYMPEVIEIDKPITPDGLNFNVVLKRAAWIDGTVIDSAGKNVNATVSYYSDDGYVGTAQTTEYLGRTVYSVMAPIGSTGVLYVDSEDYVRAKRVIKEPVPDSGLYNVDFVLSEGIALTFTQGQHYTLYYNDEIATEKVHVPLGAEVEMVYDGYNGFINIWDPAAHQPGDYPFDIITCEPEKGYEFDNFNLDPDPTSGTLLFDTNISASVKTRTDYNPNLFGFVYDKNGYPIQKAYVSLYDNETGANQTVTTNSYGYYNMKVKPEQKGLIVVTANNYATVYENINIPKDELYNQMDFTLNDGYNFILVGGTGHAMFSAQFFKNDQQYGPTVNLGNPEHLGATYGAKLTVQQDNSLTYEYDLIPGENYKINITPVSQYTFDFTNWVYREDVRELSPGTTIGIYGDTTLNANYQINLEKVAEVFQNQAGTGGKGAPQTSDYTVILMLIICSLATAGASYIYRRKKI